MDETPQAAPRSPADSLCQAQDRDSTFLTTATGLALRETRQRLSTV
jgi:hypothetical protein